VRVAVYYSNKDIRIQQQDVPEIGPGEILMKVNASGICGSDVMEWYRRDKVPLVLGHEVAGEVAEVGEGVTKFQVGDRIAASHHVPCLTCCHCRNGHETACETLFTTNFYPGGFAEYLRLPAVNVDRGTYKLPDTVTDQEGAFIEPLACVIRGQQRSGPVPCMNVLVIGCGISGLLHIALAKALGAANIVGTDIDPFRIEAARKFGASYAFKADEYSAEALKEINDGRLADMVILTAGAMPAVKQAFASLERGGTLLMFAPTDEGQTYPLNINQVFWKKDTTLTTTYAGSPADHYRALDLIAAGRVPVKEMITHVLPLDQIQKGFDLVVSGGESIKVIIEPQA
jgi:L-iditol 2-dehydrogenase